MLDYYFYTLYVVLGLTIVIDGLSTFLNKPWVKWLGFASRTVFCSAIVFCLYTMSSNVGEFAVAVWTQLQQLFFMASRGS